LKPSRLLLFWLGLISSGASLVLVAVVVLAAPACLPDLTLREEPDASDDGALPGPGCGDGVVQVLDDGGDSGESCDPGEADAAVKGCAACRVECEGTLDPSTGHCYFAPGTETAYPNAVSRCIAQNAHVVTFTSDAEVETVKPLANGRPFWVGLAYRASFSGFESAASPSEPGYPSIATDRCPGCFSASTDDAGAIPFDEALADGGTTNADCVVSRADGTWRRVACTSEVEITTICEREPPGRRQCGPSCTAVLTTAGKKLYLAIFEDVLRETAVQSCIDWGGRLVVFGSPAERAELTRQLRLVTPEPAESTYWVGLTSDGATWTWDDATSAAAGTPTSAPWGKAQPSTTAAGTRAFLRFAPSDYDTQLLHATDDVAALRGFVCERTP